MITILSRFFMKEKDKKNDSEICCIYARMCSLMGIFLNVFLFVTKIIIGQITNSIAISADACNNLADAGSCLVGMFGFWIASFGAGKEHLFGHGRMEWLIGLFSSLTVIFIGFEFAKSSIISIVNRQTASYTVTSIFVLVLSIAIKLYMYRYNHKIGQKIESSTMKAVAADCLSDCIATGSVLLSAIIGYLTGIQIDGWCGSIVALFIIYSGYHSIKEVMERIIGIIPSQTTIIKLNKYIEKCCSLDMIYDLTVHDYGFGRFVVSMRLLGNRKESKQLYLIAENITYEVFIHLGFQCTVQIDYSYENTKRKKMVFDTIKQLIEKTDLTIELQNFRMIEVEENITLMCNLVMPSALQNIGENIKYKIISVFPEYRILCSIQILHNHPMPTWI